MMRIVHFGKYYFPDVGGIENVTINLARGAASFGHSVSVVCFENSPALSNELIDGVEVIRSPITKLIASQPLGIGYVLKCLRASMNADVVHLHVPNMLGALCGLLLCSRTKLIVHWHSDVINKGFLGKLLRPLETALLRRANCIVATTQIYADASVMLASFRRKVIVVPIGIADAEPGGHDYALPRFVEERMFKRKIILAVGRLVPYKGFDVLIEAAKHLSADTLVLIVGGGPLQKHLENAVTAAGVEDRVLLTGRLSDAELRALFMRAIVFCLPSINRAEAFGVVLLEAMVFSLPIVATNIPGSGVPWVNQHGTSGLNVSTGEPEALAKACNIILNSEDFRNRLAYGSRCRFLAEFTEEISVKRMMSIYEQLVIS